MAGRQKYEELNIYKSGDYILVNVKEMGWDDMNWIHLAQDMV
jgi:hypothetical protein